MLDKLIRVDDRYRELIKEHVGAVDECPILLEYTILDNIYHDCTDPGYQPWYIPCERLDSVKDRFVGEHYVVKLTRNRVPFSDDYVLVKFRATVIDANVVQNKNVTTAAGEFLSELKIITYFAGSELSCREFIELYTAKEIYFADYMVNHMNTGYNNAAVNPALKIYVNPWTLYIG